MPMPRFPNGQYDWKIRCRKLKNQILQQFKLSLCWSHEHLQDIQINVHNENNSGSEIDILIGANFCWDFMTGEIRRRKEDPTAIKKVLGWVLHGTFQSNLYNHASVNLGMLWNYLPRRNTKTLQSLGKLKTIALRGR